MATKSHKITSLDKRTLERLRHEIEEELGPMMARYGLHAKIGSGRFTSGSCTWKLEIATETNGTVNSKEAEDFKNYCYRVNLSPEDLGATLTYGGNEYTLVGYSPRSRKFPLIGERSDGRRFKLPASAANLIHRKAQ